MIVDTSVFVALIKAEDDAADFVRRLLTKTPKRVSVGNYIEAHAVMIRKRIPHGGERLDTLIHQVDCEVVPVDAEQAALARDAYAEFGRGTGHPARLNFGDCFAYALAKATGEPLLFKGDDFSRTDITAA